MLIKHVIHLLVATSYVFASPFNHFAHDIKNDNRGLTRPEELNGIPKRLQGRRPPAYRKRQNKAQDTVSATSSPNGKLHTSGSKSRPACSSAACKNMCKLKKSKPQPLPSNYGELPEGYLSNMNGRLPARNQQSVQNQKASSSLSRSKPLSQSDFKKRADQHCDIRFQLPSAPDLAQAQSNHGVNKWWSSAGVSDGRDNTCTWRMFQNDRYINGIDFEVAYGYDPVLLETFFRYVMQSTRATYTRRPIINCNDLNRVFNSPRREFRGSTLAQALAMSLSSIQQRPDELFILEEGVNRMKELFMSGRVPPQARLDFENKPMESSEELRAQLADASLSFEFMNIPVVSGAFTRVNQRLRSVLDMVDREGAPKPAGFPSWRAVYDDWLSKHLVFSERVADQWIDHTVEYFQQSLENIEGLDKDDFLEWTLWTNRENPNGRGMLHPNRIKYSSAYPITRSVRRDGTISLSGRDIPNKRKNEAQNIANDAPTNQKPATLTSRNLQHGVSVGKGKSTCAASGCSKCKWRRNDKSTHTPAKTGKIPINNSKHSDLSQRSDLQKRAREAISSNLGGMVLDYSVPLRVTVSTARSVVSRWWFAKEVFIENTCRWDISQNPRGPPTDVNYAVKYAYEPILLKMFLQFLLRAGVSDPRSLQSTFQVDDTHLGIPRVQILANQLTKSDHVAEMFILEADIQKMTYTIMSGQHPQISNTDELRGTLILVGLAFQFLRKSEVSSAFGYVNERMRNVLHRLDGDQNTMRPRAVYRTWLEAYNSWVKQHLRSCQRTISTWLDERAIPAFQTVSYNNPSDLTWIQFQRYHPEGSLHPSKIVFGDRYPH